MKTNSWKEGQEISCHENIAEHFINKGIASDPEEKQNTNPKKPKK